MRNRLLELLVCDKANSDSLGRMAGMVSHHEEMTSPQVHSLIHLIAKSSKEALVNEGLTSVSA